MDSYVLGIDGCHSGWLVCRCEIPTKKIIFQIFPCFNDAVKCHTDAKLIAIDIPIGLRDDGQNRCCEIEARRLLAPNRSSSVFSAPPRSLLHARTFLEANEISRSQFGKGVSKQSFAIFPKISEVDRSMTLELQKRVFEVHPELCFWRFDRRAMSHRKKSREGYEERRTLLQSVGFEIPEWLNWRDIAPGQLVGATRDDLLDATVAAHTACLAYLKKAERLPSQPVVDKKGLRMEMVY